MHQLYDIHNIRHKCNATEHLAGACRPKLCSLKIAPAQAILSNVGGSHLELITFYFFSCSIFLLYLFYVYFLTLNLNKPNVKYNFPILKLNFPLFQWEFPVFQFIYPELDFNVPLIKLDRLYTRFNFPKIKNEFSNNSIRNTSFKVEFSTTEIQSWTFSFIFP